MPRRRDGFHRGVAPRGRRPITLALALTLALSTSLAFAAPAGASPQNDLAAKTARARKLEAQIEADHRKAEMLNEQYLQAQQAVADTQKKIQEAEAGIARADADAKQSRLRLSGRAATLYMGAGNNDPFSINTTDVRELGSRAKYGEAAADEDQRLLDKLNVAEETLGIQRKNYQKIQGEARSQQKAADEALKAVKQATAVEQQELDSVKGDIGNLVNQIQREKQAADDARARAEFAAVQARARAAAAAEAAATSNNSTPTTGGNQPSIGGKPFNVPAPSGGAAAAVAYAWAQVGKPYRYAGTGPDAYDCSGLTMMAWAQGGVSMPHGSIAQGAMFPRVPDSDLKPGDLAIYYADHGHVGMYVGNGMTISATHTGDFVRLQPVFREGYQYSVRPG
jgi:cell wall-associated NlpC family hydrolase